MIFSLVSDLSLWKMVAVTTAVAMTIYHLYHTLSDEKRRSDVSLEFFSEAERELGYTRLIPKEEMGRYTYLKTSIMNEPAVKALIKPQSLDEEELSNDALDKSWIRRLAEYKGTHEQEMKTYFEQLRRGLMTRGIKNVPRWLNIVRDLKAKHRLWEKKLISDTQWKGMLRHKDDLEAELIYLKREADKMIDAWGSSDKFLKDINAAYMESMKRTMQAKLMHDGGMQMTRTASGRVAQAAA